MEVLTLPNFSQYKIALSPIRVKTIPWKLIQKAVMENLTIKKRP